MLDLEQGNGLYSENRLAEQNEQSKKYATECLVYGCAAILSLVVIPVMFSLVYVIPVIFSLVVIPVILSLVFCFLSVRLFIKSMKSTEFKYNKHKIRAVFGLSLSGICICVYILCTILFIVALILFGGVSGPNGIW